MPLEVALDARAQHACAFAVDDAHLMQPGQRGLVQVAIHLGQRLVLRHAAHVQLQGHAACGRASLGQHGALLFLGGFHNAQLGQVRFQLHDAGLNKHLTLVVRQGQHSAARFQVHDFHMLAQAHRFGGDEMRSAGHGQPFAELVQPFFHALFERLHLMLRGLRLLFQGFELADDGLGLAARILHHTLAILLGLAQGFLPAFLHLAAQLLGLVAQADGLAMRLLRHFALPLGNLPMVLGVGDHVLKAHIVLGQQLLGAFNQRIRETKLAADLKGVALAGDADGKAVGGAQGSNIELHTGVFHPGGG